MNLATTVFTTGLVAALVATPILAQRAGDRPSRECRQEVVKLCGTDRSTIRACLQQKADQLSEACSGELRQRMQARQAQGLTGAQTSGPAVKVDTTVFYGSHQRQQIDIYKPADAVDDLPLVLFIHGGGWSFGSHKAVQAKPAHFTKADFIFGSAGYRVLPDAPVEEQAGDIGDAIQSLRAQANAQGFDPDSIILMGHSAGAHLAALVATDPQYAGDAFGAIKGVVLLDGAGYDITTSMMTARPQAQQLYSRVFGSDVARHERLSPITHVSAGDAPHWLALYVDTRERAKGQAETLVEALRSSGANALDLPIANTDHGRLNREIGTPAGAQQTEAIDAFLKQIR
ncbi:MAG: alpha/beta hydrolase [Pseudomonadota bacterium]